jgi:acyl-CoA reductase-like NAD-dependent aldehyde dehydrogenase
VSTVGVEHQQLLIGGRWTDASSGDTYEKRNPYTGEPAGSAAAATREDARAAVEAAREAFRDWSAQPPERRAEVLRRAPEILMERQQDIAQIVTDETGGTFGWGMFNVELGAGMLAFNAEQADKLSSEPIPSHIPGKEAQAVRQAVGVVVGIAPWNAPVILGVRAIAAPLAYGNTVVFKASEECPRTHAAIVHALEDAGAPPGVVNLITNDPADAADVVDELIAHPAVRRVNFTGSTRVGRIVAENAARHLKRSSWAARRRWSSWPTPTWTARSPPQTSARSCTRARSACPPSGS